MERKAGHWIAAVGLLAGAALVAAARWPAVPGVVGALARDAAVPGRFILSNLGWSLASIGLAAMLLLAADMTGGELCAFWTGRRPRGRARLVALFPGWYVPAFSLMALAAVRLWYSPLVVAVALLPVMVSLPRWQGLRASGEDARVPGTAVIAVLLLLVPLLLALSPELNMDCLRYHLSLPEHMLRRHGLIGDPVPLGWSLTSAADYPNALVQVAGFDGAARLVRPLLGLAGALALAGTLAGPGVPMRALLLSSLVALIVPVESWQVMATAKNDAVVCGTMLAAAAILLGGAPERRPFRHGPPGSERPDHAGAGALMAGGLLLGLGFAAKAVTAGLSAALAAAVLLRRGSRRLGGAAWLAAGALPAVAPWVALSFLGRGDPFYPAGILLFPGLFAGSTDADSFRRAYEGFLYRTRRMTEWPGVLGGLTLRNAFPALAVVPLLALGEHRSRLVAAAAGLGGLLLTLFQLPGFYFSERFGYPAQALMNVAALTTLVAAGGRGFAPAILGAAATIRLAVALLAANAEVTPLAFHSGRLSPAAYVRAGTGAYGAVLGGVQGAVAPDDGLIVSGETLTAGLPGRVLSSGYGPPPIWQAVAESDTPDRIAVRLRQRRVRFILHNLPLALIERYQATAWRWNRRSLALLHRFAGGRLAVRAWSGRSDPGFGSDWLVEVLPRPRRVRGPVLFLPGMESVYADATQAAFTGNTSYAVSRLRAIRAAIPGVALTDSLLANALVAGGKYAEAYPLVRASVAAGLVDETNVLDLAVAAARTGRRAEAERALARAKEVYPLWPGRVEAARLKAGVGPR